MLNTNGRPGKAKWLLTHFPEYLNANGKPHLLQVGTGRIRGQKSTAENAPWKFVKGELNIHGYTAEPYPDKPSWWPWFKKTYVTQAEYETFINSLNYYRNGGKTASGQNKGLDPLELVGGVREVGENDYRCPRGVYTPVNVVDAEPATFNFDSGDTWHGDKPAPRVPTWN